MKIKLTQEVGCTTIHAGDCVDAAVTPVNGQAYFFDSTGMGWFANKDQYMTLMQDESDLTLGKMMPTGSPLPPGKIELIKTPSVSTKTQSLIAILGAKPRKMTIEWNA